MIAQSVAETLVEKGERVLMIFASSELFDDYINSDDTTSIDELRMIESPKSSDIDQVIREQNGLKYIRGVSKELKKRYFSPVLLKKIAREKENEFDYIIIDGGHNYNYPLPIGALQCATRRFYVISHDMRSNQRFNFSLQTVIRLDNISGIGEKDQVILNKYERTGGPYTIDQIEKLYGFPVSTVPYCNDGRSAEANKKTLKSMSKQFNSSIINITNKILKE